jgi:hypothetical protein
MHRSEVGARRGQYEPVKGPPQLHLLPSLLQRALLQLPSPSLTPVIEADLALGLLGLPGLLRPQGAVPARRRPAGGCRLVGRCERRSRQPTVRAAWNPWDVETIWLPPVPPTAVAIVERAWAELVQARRLGREAVAPLEQLLSSVDVTASQQPVGSSRLKARDSDAEDPVLRTWQ